MRQVTDLLKRTGPILGVAAVVILFVIIAPSAFYSIYNIKTVATQSVIVGIGALGMTFVIISGGIDLSIGSVIALSTVVAARVMNLSIFEGAIAPFIAVVAAILCGGICGLFNGVVSTIFKIVPFIVTLGMMQIARGCAKWIGAEQTVLAPPSWLNTFMEVDPTPRWLIVAPGVWIMVSLAIVTTIVLRYTVFGRYVFALGSNESTARLCGIRVNFHRSVIYILCGMCAGLAGIMQFANLTVGDPTAAQGMELDIIAAVVIGGGSLSGGEGSALGSLLGAIMMAILRNGCNLVGIPNYVQNILIGTIIVGAVAIDRYKQTGI